MDIQMPVMDGFEAAARIKELPGCRDIPIVFITAYHRDEPFVTRGYEVGGVDYFSKPFDPEILKKKVAIYGAFRQQGIVLEEREHQIDEIHALLGTGRKLSGALQQLPVGILFVDPDGHVTHSNDEASRICKVDESVDRDAYGKVLGWAKAGGEGSGFKGSVLASALEQGASTHNPLLGVRCLDGTEKTVLISFSPLLGPERTPIGVVVVIQDMTKPKEIETEFEKRIERLISDGLEPPSTRSDLPQR